MFPESSSGSDPTTWWSKGQRMGKKSINFDSKIIRNWIPKSFSFPPLLLILQDKVHKRWRCSTSTAGSFVLPSRSPKSHLIWIYKHFRISTFGECKSPSCKLFNIPRCSFFQPQPLFLVAHNGWWPCPIFFFFFFYRIFYRCILKLLSLGAADVGPLSTCLNNSRWLLLNATQKDMNWGSTNWFSIPLHCMWTEDGRCPSTSELLLLLLC